MPAEDLLRLAWEADHDGRRALRDALLTLAIAESDPDDAWPERCRARLVAERPGHYLGEFATVHEALGDPRVVASRDRLRRKYPEGRVAWLLLGAGASRGAYTGRAESLDAIIEDLAWIPAEAENVRLDAAQAARGPLGRRLATAAVGYAIAYPPMPSWGDPSGARPAEESAEWARSACGVDPDGRRFHYFSILFALALLLASMPRED